MTLACFKCLNGTAAEPLQLELERLAGLIASAFGSDKRLLLNSAERRQRLERLAAIGLKRREIFATPLTSPPLSGIWARKLESEETTNRHRPARGFRSGSRSNRERD